jgi:SNF2 family DNA or RNA helicase
MAVLKPRKHQQELMDFHQQSKMMGTLAWHDMGLGKTLASLWLARQQIKDLKRKGIPNPKFMVICPKSANTTWKVECSKNTPDLIGSMILAPYSQLHNLVHRVKYVDIRFLIFDESHYLKSPETNRIEKLANMIETIASMNGEFKHGRIISLSGTPMPNGAHELYTTWALCTSPNLLEAATRLRDEDRYKLWKETFAARKEKSWETYRGGKKQGASYEGVANEHKLNEILKHFVHLRRSQDCLDLPAVNINPINLNLPDDRLLKDANIEEPEAYMALLERLAKAKAPYLFDWVKDFLAGTTEQLVVFSMYTWPVRQLKDKFLKNVCIITGEESDEERANNIKAFQQGHIRVIAMSYACGSESLNFQNACHTLYHGYPWTDGKLKQAIARTARQGQQRHTFHHFLTSGENDTINLHRVRRKEAATKTVEGLLLES